MFAKKPSRVWPTAKRETSFQMTKWNAFGGDGQNGKMDQIGKIEVEELLEFIGDSAPTNAFRLAEKIRKAADSLAENAERGRIVPKLEAYFLREIFVSRYRLMYEIKPSEIEIISIVHMSRDLRNVFPIHQND